MARVPIISIDAYKKIISRRLCSEIGWIVLGQAGSAVAGLFGLKILTHVLNPVAFGKLSLANTIVVLISTNFLFGPLGQGLMRFWAISKSQGNLNEFYSVSNQFKKYTIALCLIIGIIFVLAVALFTNMEWAALLAVATAAGILSGWLGLRTAVFTAARKRHWVAFLNIGNALFKPVIAACLVLLVAVSAFWAMVGYLVAVLLLLILAERFYLDMVTNTQGSTSILDNNITSDIWKNIISFSWPFAVWAVFAWVHLACDKWTLQAFHGPEIVGAFVVISQLAKYPLLFGSGFLTTFIIPIAYQRAGDLTQHKKIISAYKFLAFMAGVYILGLLLLMWLYFMFHRGLVLFISNIEFVKFSFLLPWLTAAWGIYYLGQILANFGMVANKSQIYIAPKILAATIAGISTFYLSAKYQVIGVVCGLTLASLVYTFWCFVMAIKMVNVHRMPFLLKEIT